MHLEIWQQTTKIGSQYPIDETIEKIESTARAVNLIVNRMDCFQVQNFDLSPSNSKIAALLT